LRGVLAKLGRDSGELVNRATKECENPLTRIPYGRYQFKVSSFELINAPTTFQTSDEPSF
jgi:hypothetical protein